MSRFIPIVFVALIGLVFPAGSMVSLIAGSAAIFMTVVTVTDDDE